MRGRGKEKGGRWFGGGERKGGGGGKGRKRKIERGVKRREEVSGRVKGEGRKEREEGEQEECYAVGG